MDSAMKEILIKDKQKYLEENYPFEKVPLLTHHDKDDTNKTSRPL